MTLNIPSGPICFRHVVALLLLGAIISGCSPLLPLVGAALGGGSDKPVAGGPFGRAPSSVQNSRPSESTINDALAGVDDRIRPTCQAQLPRPEPNPVSGCVLRPTCLPGSDRPLPLRMCADGARTTLSDAKVKSGIDWRWSAEPVAGGH